MSGKLPFGLLPGLPSRDDPELESLMAVVTRLPRKNADEIVRNLLQAALGHKRTSDPGYLTCLAEDALVTIALRRDPRVDQALREAPDSPAGPGGSVDVEAFLRERGLGDSR